MNQVMSSLMARTISFASTTIVLQTIRLYFIRIVIIVQARVSISHLKPEWQERRTDIPNEIDRPQDGVKLCSNLDGHI